MRVMVIVKATSESEAGVMPGTERFAARAISRAPSCRGSLADRARAAHRRRMSHP